MIFATEIKQYISQLKTKSGNPAGVQEQTRTENILTAFCNKLETWPEETDYDTFRAEIDKPDNPKFATENINRVKKFFAWLELERKNDTMTKNEVIDVEETTQPLDGNANTEITAPIEPEETTTPAPVKKKSGRKVFDTVNGEKKSEKLMLYLTPALIAKLRVWCDMKGISNVSYITALIETDLDSKTDKINTFLKLRSEL